MYLSTKFPIILSVKGFPNGLDLLYRRQWSCEIDLTSACMKKERLHYAMCFWQCLNMGEVQHLGCRIPAHKSRSWPSQDPVEVMPLWNVIARFTYLLSGVSLLSARVRSRDSHGADSLVLDTYAGTNRPPESEAFPSLFSVSGSDRDQAICTENNVI